MNQQFCTVDRFPPKLPAVVRLNDNDPFPPPHTRSIAWSLANRDRATSYTIAQIRIFIQSESVIQINSVWNLKSCCVFRYVTSYLYCQQTINCQVSSSLVIMVIFLWSFQKWHFTVQYIPIPDERELPDFFLSVAYPSESISQRECLHIST